MWYIFKDLFKKNLREQRYEKEVNDLMKIDQTPSFVVWWCKLWKIYHIPQFLTRKQAEQVMTRTGEYSFDWSNAQYIQHWYSKQMKDIQRIRDLANSSNQDITLTDEDVATLGGRI